MVSPTPSRRRLLRAAGTTTLAALAGCATAPNGAGTTTGPAGTATPTATAAEGLGPVALRPVATGFDAPLDFAHAPSLGRRYVVDQSGTISVLTDGGHEPFLDLTDRIDPSGSEKGLLGLALHPDYADNGRLYVRYSAPPRPATPATYDHTFVLSEFRAADDGASADRATERTLMEVPEPQANHNAGSLAFGPDGYLYVGAGDGGAANDQGPGHAEDWYGAVPGGNGQDVTTNLLGSMLRVDVDGRTGQRAYGIPADNPLVGEVGLDELYAWGFRNPWRFAFDGDRLIVGDVGQSRWEEVDVVERGGNYGWNVKEGTHCFQADSCPDATPEGQPLRDPVLEYPHGGGAVSGIAIIGGYVYRGDALPGLAGRYVFGDLQVGGRLFVADPAGDRWPVGTVPIAAADRGRLAQLLSFGRDADGRLYALGRGGGDGGVYELVAAG